MLAALLNNWKPIAVAFLAFGLHLLWMAYIVGPAQQRALESQKTALIEECKADKALTEKVSNDYQAKAANLNDQLAALKRLHQPRCLPIAGEAGRLNGGPTKDKLSGRNGVDSSTLYDYAAKAERCRLQLIGLQDFINRVWDAQ